jgi:hypothetical protein
MKRILSDIGGGNTIIERAGSPVAFTLADWEIRERCRNAPQFVRRNIDARREARGLPPLWERRSVDASRPRRRPAGTPANVAKWKAFLALARSRQTVAGHRA